MCHVITFRDLIIPLQALLQMSEMENEKYHTPKQTPSVTERRRRRRESAIPGTSNSPIVSVSYLLMGEGRDH